MMNEGDIFPKRGRVGKDLNDCTNVRIWGKGRARDGFPSYYSLLRVEWGCYHTGMGVGQWIGNNMGWVGKDIQHNLNGMAYFKGWCWVKHLGGWGYCTGMRMMIVNIYGGIHMLLSVQVWFKEIINTGLGSWAYIFRFSMIIWDWVRCYNYWIHDFYGQSGSGDFVSWIEGRMQQVDKNWLFIWSGGLLCATWAGDWTACRDQSMGDCWVKVYWCIDWVVSQTKGFCWVMGSFYGKFIRAQMVQFWWVNLGWLLDFLVGDFVTCCNRQVYADFYSDLWWAWPTGVSEKPVRTDRGANTRLGRQSAWYAGTDQLRKWLAGWLLRFSNRNAGAAIRPGWLGCRKRWAANWQGWPADALEDRSWWLHLGLMGGCYYVYVKTRWAMMCYDLVDFGAVMSDRTNMGADSAICLVVCGQFGLYDYGDSPGYRRRGAVPAWYVRLGKDSVVGPVQHSNRINCSVNGADWLGSWAGLPAAWLGRPTDFLGQTVDWLSRPVARHECAGGPVGWTEGCLGLL
ncbi:hypothetical protein E3N88_02587 [Mikania micrantha]|uniref:Uncharacterized protein n=1 Tax=Mikania micrantha TaxID=192012 RepID=A0A5N6Q671_9ASTR|nr:hypothetical protein E3N88_02587 [Mikania micrantha]